MSYCRLRGSYALTLILAAALSIAIPLPAWALHLGTTHLTWPAENVKDTLHNLSTSNPVAGVNIAAGANPTTEVCVFCHTPHGSAANPGGAAPLWNRAIPAGSAYTAYTSPTFDTTPSNAPAGVSLACLSCHDGVIALDAFINAPGSGGFRGLDNATTTNAIAEGATSDFLDVDNSMSDTSRDTTGGKNYEAMTGAKPFPNLTRDLRDDHPISMPLQATGGDPQFDDVSVTTVVGNVVLIARTNKLSPADRRDALRLYPPSGGSALDVTNGYRVNWVECASCHNPHAPRPEFLRLPNHTSSIEKGGGTTTATAVGGGSGSLKIADDPNVGSAICISCHEK